MRSCDTKEAALFTKCSLITCNILCIDVHHQRSTDRTMLTFSIHSMQHQCASHSQLNRKYTKRISWRPCRRCMNHMSTLSSHADMQDLTYPPTAVCLPRNRKRKEKSKERMKESKEAGN